jgi:hypothetical protein
MMIQEHMDRWCVRPRVTVDGMSGVQRGASLVLKHVHQGAECILVVSLLACQADSASDEGKPTAAFVASLQ